MVKKTKKAAAAAAPAVNAAQAAWPFPINKPAPIQPVEENSLESPEAGLLSNVASDDPDTSMAADEQVEPARHVRASADLVKLFTDPAQNQAQLIPVQQLLESPFNPRTRFDAKALQDLADTIRDHGVMQPILVRPVATPGVEIKRGDEPVQAYEIVFGHRRYRASKLAEVGAVPAFVRELSDEQSAQLQAIENVQREDLDPIEEAQGFAHYIAAHGISKEQLADEIGMSRTHVYNRLKLLNAVDSVQVALRAREIDAEVALLIARIHSSKLQEKALASLRSNGHALSEGGKTSYRRIRDFLKERFTLRLKEALFPIGDATLLEGADACTTCPKRSGNALEYANIVSVANAGHWEKQGPNLCTDPECWEAKTTQHLANEAAKLQAKGKTVVTGNKARQAIGADGKVKGQYIALKDVKAELAKAKKAGQGGEVQTVLIQDPRTGKNVEAVKRDEVTTAGVKLKEAPAKNGQYDHAAEQKRMREEEARVRGAAAEQTRINSAILGAVRQAAAGAPLPAFAVQMVAKAALAGVDHHDRALLATLHGFKNFDQLRKAVGQMPVDRCTTLLLDCALIEKVTANPWRLEDKPDTLLHAAKHWEVNVQEIRADLAAAPADTATAALLPDAEFDEQEFDEEEAA